MKRAIENYVQNHGICVFLLKKIRKLPWNQMTIQKIKIETP